MTKLKAFLMPLPHATFASFALLLIRMIAGTAFILHGKGKIENPFGWMGPESPVPGFFQALAAFSEFGGGIAWVLGLLTPLASLGIGFTMVVATYMHVIMLKDPFVSQGGSSYEPALGYLGIAILLLALGPGKFSIDARMMKRLALALPLALGFLAATPVHACHMDAKPVWDLPGFENPESAYYDAATDTIYVSNIAGDPTAKDGKGFISTVTPDGKIKDLHWIDGLNAPKGIRIAEGLLYVTDIDRVVVVRISEKKIVRTIAVPDAKFLNDLGLNEHDTIYVTDTFGKAIYSITRSGEVKRSVSGPQTEAPNGILMEGAYMYVAAWGKNVKPDFSTETPGRLLRIDRKTKMITAITPNPIGHLDGIEKDKHGDWLISDWMAGTILHVTAKGDTRELIKLKPGTADIGFIASRDLVLVPKMNENRLTAYRMK